MKIRVNLYNKLKEYLTGEEKKTKLVLVALSVAVGISLTACSINNNKYQELDRSMIITEETSVEERKSYYEQYVDNIIAQMSEKEKEQYYIEVSIEYSGEEAYSGDKIVFLRNDNVYKGDTINIEDKVKLPPGIYRIISRDVKDNDGVLGEIELLVPGEPVTLKIDYDHNEAKIVSNGQKTRWYTFFLINYPFNR